MVETIKQCCSHFGISNSANPFTEAQVDGDVNADAFIEFTEKKKEQRVTRGAERQISRLVQDHPVGLDQRLGDLAGLTLGLFLPERVGPSSTNTSHTIRTTPFRSSSRMRS